jgi:hypothetical protein
MLRTAIVAIVAGFVLALGACGSDDEPAAPEVERLPETADALPKLPRGYEPYISRVSGIAIGRPPGWEARDRGIAATLTAPDQLVVMSLSADRTDQAVAADPRTLAVRTFQALDGYEGELDPTEPRPFKHPYEAYEARGEGVAASTGVRQRLRVIVLRREGTAVVTAVIAENAKIGARAEVEQALDAVSTLRTRPVG